MNIFKILFGLYLLIAFLSCAGTKEIVDSVDKNASKETKALLVNLKKISGQQILFGHQDAIAYGVNWKEHHKMRSDVKDVCGSHPAVFGWEISKIGSSDISIDSVDFNEMKEWIKEVYKHGGVNTISWHMDNLINGKSSWDVGEKVVAAILPGGEKHKEYLRKLDHFANFAKDLKVGFFRKTKVPIILRMFHEHTGSWFWWGQPHCTPEEYKRLWRFTVQYLRDVKGLNNLLFCYSPDVVRDAEQYLQCYPGKEWVDILGLDDYHDLRPTGSSEEMVNRLNILIDIAKKEDKVAALTETGQESIPESNWWTKRLLEPIKMDSTASQIAWILVWRNARNSHHYAPYPSHPSSADFLKFFADPKTVFMNNLPDMYKN